MASTASDAYHNAMPYYEVRIYARGAPPNRLLPGIRPAKEAGSELIEAKDDNAAAIVGQERQLGLGDEFIVSVYADEDGNKVMVYPRSGCDA
jgi:hypothetical protein